jgi:hypothetical protein
VEGPPVASPPVNPAVGSCYLVANGATGSWAGQDGALAGFTDGGWRFCAAVEGMRVLDRSNGQMVVRRSGVWESGIARIAEVRIGDQPVLRQRQAAISDPAAGTVIDSECRAAVSGILTAMRAHGLIN